MSTYYGPASELILGDGTVVHPGDEVALDEATQAALEKSGHQFSDTEARHAPQSAAENLAEQGTTPEQAADAAGLSAGMGQAVPGAAALPSTPPAPGTPPPPAAPKK